MKARNLKLTTEIHKSLSALDVSVDKNTWGFYRAIDMRLSGKVNNDVGLNFFKKFFNARAVANVEFLETKVRVF